MDSAEQELNSLMEGFEHGRIPLLEFMRSAHRIIESSDIHHDERLGKAVVGCFSRHTEGRDLMACLLEIQGFEVIPADSWSDLKDIIELCEDPEVRVLCLSVQTTYDCPELFDLGEMLRDAGVRERLVVNGGGAALTESLAKKMDSDVYYPTAVASAKAVKERVLERV